MALTLNTNIDSLNAQRNLTSSQSSLSQALQRLSSGLRINSAADDPAGLAIASRFTTQINGVNQAINNANFAVSEAQTAGGALSTITSNLQSIRTLAVEAANGSNSSADRAALDQQVQQQIAEITQIAAQTAFNGVNVLDGSSGVTTYQVGPNVGNTISINLAQGVRADQIGQVATAVGGAVTNAALATGTLSIGVGTATPTAIEASSLTAGTATGQTSDSAYAKVAAINAANISGLTATADTNLVDTWANITSTGGTSSYTLTINGTTIYGGNGNIASGGTLTGAQVAQTINTYSGTTGVTASFNGSAVVLDAADGRNIITTQTVANGTGTAAGTGLATANTTTRGAITLSAASNIVVQGTDATTNLGATAQGLTYAVSNGTTLSGQNVQTVTAANATIASVDAALQTVSNFQAQLGAIQGRFASAVSNLQSTSQNLTSSRSTIQNADFAAETANLTQAQVLQQAGISVLAQANQEPQLILKLLQ
jgi:flagellin